MMAIHYPLTTPMELYLCVSTMCMVLCVMTSGILWMPLLCVLSLVSQQMVSILLYIVASLLDVHAVSEV